MHTFIKQMQDQERVNLKILAECPIAFNGIEGAIYMSSSMSLLLNTSIS